MTEQLILNELFKISQYSIPEQIDVIDLLKQNELYSMYSGVNRTSKEKVCLKKYKIDVKEIYKIE